MKKLPHPKQKHLNVFISHSHKDMALVRLLRQKLKQKGIECYVALEDPQLGGSLNAKIRQHIDESDFLIALITKHSKDSTWQQQEIGRAAEKVIPLIEGRTRFEGLPGDVEPVRFDSSNFDLAFIKTAKILAERSAASDIVPTPETVKSIINQTKSELRLEHTESLIYEPVTTVTVLPAKVRSIDLNPSSIVALRKQAYAKLEKGVTAFNKWRESIVNQTINLTELEWTNADCRKLNLRNTDLSSSNLKNADFERADLRDALFVGADLRKANFKSADLRGVELSFANLRGVSNWTGVKSFEGANLYSVKGLGSQQLKFALSRGAIQNPSYYSINWRYGY